MRSTNQDNFYCAGKTLNSNEQGTAGVISGNAITDANCLFAVFDGVGGEEHGEVASRLAAQMAGEFDFSEGGSAIREYINQANKRIVTYTAENHLSSCSSTAAMMLFQKKQGWICNLGDSRIYMLQSGQLQQLSVDHVWPGYDDKKPPLSQCLGIPEAELRLEPYIQKIVPTENALFIICSDGLTDMIEESQIADLSAKGEKLEETALNLMDASLAAGGTDNITIMLLRLTRNKFSWRQWLTRRFV